MNIDVTGVFQQNWDGIHLPCHLCNGVKKSIECSFCLDSGREYKYILNIGSSRSSKTYSLIDCYDLYARGNGNKRMTVWRSTKKDCKDTVMDDYLKRLVSTNRFDRYRFNKTESVYLYGNNSKIEFRGADEDGAHGLTQDCAWLNEPYEIPAETFHQIDQRTSDFVFIDLNPKQNHWSDDLLTNPRTYIIHSTFRDNPFCPPEQKAKILSYDPDNEENVKNKTANLFRWQVYGLGIKGEVEGKVFHNYYPIEEIPLSAKKYGAGFDYGYSMDPTAIVNLYECPELNVGDARAIILDEVIYNTGLQPTPLNLAMRKALMHPNDLIIGDRTAQLMMDELYDRGWINIHAAKGDNSIDYGISKMQELIIYITARSTNLLDEFDNYKNEKDKFGKYINTPAKNQKDHCFIGNTIIETINGGVRIDLIKEGDLILTSKGYKKCLKVWNNGVKTVNNYLIQSDILSVNLTSTNNHLIYTESSWTEISKLSKGQTVSFLNHSKESPLKFSQEKDILIMEESGCTFTYGSIITKLYRMDSIFIILMRILGIIELKISNLKKLISISRSMGRRGIEKIQSGQKIFRRKVSRLHLNGISQKPVSSGIETMQLNADSGISHLAKGSAMSAKKNLRPLQSCRNFAQTNANLNSEGTQELMMPQEYALNASQNLSAINTVTKSIVQKVVKGPQLEELVYDLMIDECHEYFANGILVHNCIDSSRYIITEWVTRKPFFVV